MHITTSFPKAKLETILPFSRYAQRLLESEPDLRPALLENIQQPYSRKEMQAFLNAHSDTIDDEVTLHRILRNLRKNVFLRLAVRDLGGLADLTEVMICMTNLAEVTIKFALKYHQTWLSAPSRFGLPKGEDSGKTQEMLVVAMGKLGGNELNVSSDIDLIFIYPEDGETNGARSISNHDFFARLGRKLIASLNDFTVDSYVFRVDMRLRPYGESSALAISFAMLKEYFITQGREWERYAWIKCRVITGTKEDALILTEQLARPFVFRKYLDFGAYESMRLLHTKLRKEVERREMLDNIKLGPGGIREIEFITQVFQLIRGGHDVDLCIRPTLAVLKRLRQKKQLSTKAVTELLDAYGFLRKLEHRLQYLDDQQTQTLPNNPEDQTLISTAMGYSNYNAFLKQLNHHRNNVTHHFDLVFAAPIKSPIHDTLAHLQQEETVSTNNAQAATTQLSTMGFAEPEKVSQRIQLFYTSSLYHQLAEPNQKKITALVPALIEVVTRFPPVEQTLERLLKLLETISQHTAYLDLLLEHPETLQRVAKLASTSQWANNYLGRHPILLDELLQQDTLRQLPDWSVLEQELTSQLNHINNPKTDIIEWQMDVLRHFQHAQVFRLLASDLEEQLLLETLSDHLTALADRILDNAFNLAWKNLKKKHHPDAKFCIIGYGKLGGKELGYVSDLDIIFLYDDDHPDAAETYTKLAKSINAWLTNLTSVGFLYETDLRLRPNGETGLLVNSIEAFKNYQYNQAWSWEHQALTRARFVAGDHHLENLFERTRKAILCQQRNRDELKHDIVRMREKMLSAHPNTTPLFDIKHDRGGIIDVEFMVQYLVLGYAHQHPQLTANIGNLALLKLAGELALVSIEAAEAVRIAYREFRRVQHRLRLSGDTGLINSEKSTGESQKFARIEADYLKDHRMAVLQLWEQVFNM